MNNNGSRFRNAFRSAALFFALALLVVPLNSSAKCTAHDGWSGDDKDLHAIAGAGIASIATAYSGDPRAGFYVGTAAGVAKEFYDAAGAGTCSLPDLLITVGSAAIGAYLTNVVITHNRGLTAVSYSFRFLALKLRRWHSCTRHGFSLYAFWHIPKRFD